MIRRILSGASATCGILGFQVDWERHRMKLSMFLKKTEPDLDAAATLQVRKNVKEDKKLAKGEKESCSPSSSTMPDPTHSAVTEAMSGQA